MFECQPWYGWHSSHYCVLLPGNPTHRLQTRVLCHPPYAVHCTKVLWSWLWLQSLHQQNSPCTTYHHQRYFRFSERLLGSNFIPTPTSPVSSSSPSILKPRTVNFPELFNSCKDPVRGADQARLGARICSQKVSELSKHNIQWMSAKITSTYFAGRSSKQDQDRMLTRQVWPALRYHTYSKYLRFMS